MDTQHGRMALHPGFCALMRPGGIYDAVHDEKNPLGITYIHFELTLNGAPDCKSREMLPEFPAVDNFLFVDETARRIVERVHCEPRVAEALLRGLLMDLIATPGAQVQPEDRAARHREAIRQLMSELRSEPPDRLGSVQELAGRMNLSPEHFSRVFRKVAGMSPLDYILDIRVSHARHLLMESSLTVGEIADRLGYRDVYFFSRQFKQKTGLSPRFFRNRFL